MSKTTIGFNIHPTKTLRYLIKEGKTLVFKSRVNFDTGIGLDIYPMSTGEILEKVCKMYADGFTEGNKSIKAISNNVTYNTDAVTKGALYCISYRDGGFYVGLRTTEDYEPKEGDWWCFKAVFQPVPYKPKMAGRNNLGVITEAYQYISYYDNKSAQLIGGTKCTSVNYGYYFSTSTNNNYGNAVLLKNEKNEYLYPLRLDDTTLGYNLLAIADDTNSRWNHLVEDFDIDLEHSFPWYFISKFITASDILSYQNTGKMGGIILGEEINVSYSSNHTSCSITIDNAKDYAIFFFDVDNNLVNVEYATQNRHGAKGTIYNANANNIYNIYATQLFDKMYIYNKDFEAVYDDGVISRGMTLNLTNDSISYAYTIRVFKVLQNNMATLSLLSNNLNSNSNDETDG